MNRTGDFLIVYFTASSGSEIFQATRAANRRLLKNHFIRVLNAIFHHTTI